MKQIFTGTGDKHFSIFRKRESVYLTGISIRDQLFNSRNSKNCTYLGNVQAIYQKPEWISLKTMKKNQYKYFFYHLFKSYSANYSSFRAISRQICIAYSSMKEPILPYMIESGGIIHVISTMRSIRKERCRTTHPHLRHLSLRPAHDIKSYQRRIFSRVGI